MLRIIYSFRYALTGWWRFAAEERNGQLQLIAFVVTLALGFVFRISGAEWLIVILCSALVLGFEMLNSAIEKLCNIVHPEWHPQIKRIKDLSAGAVLMTAVASVVIAAIIFIPKIFA